MAETNIRQATMSDLAEISELEDRWGREEITWGFCRATIEELSSAIRKGCFVAEVDGVHVQDPQAGSIGSEE